MVGSGRGDWLALQDLPGADRPVPRRAGYLIKKNDLLAGGVRAQLRSWRQYWTELIATELFFYSEGPSGGRRAERPVGSLSVRGAMVAFDYTKRKHVFTLSLSDRGRYLFRASNDDDMKEWVRAFEQTAPATAYMHGADVVGSPVCCRRAPPGTVRGLMRGGRGRVRLGCGTARVCVPWLRGAGALVASALTAGGAPVRWWHRPRRAGPDVFARDEADSGCDDARVASGRAPLPAHVESARAR